MATSLGTEVVIDDEQYSLLSYPQESSALVRVEKKKLLGSIDLEQLVKYLGHVGSFIRIAYNGVGAAGPKFQDLQIEIQRLGYDITKLCDKSAVTVASFKSTSDIVLSKLKSTYQYLLSGLDNIALISLSSLAELAGKMAAAAHDLQLEFEEQERKVISTLETTQKQRASEEIRKEELKREQERMEQQKQVQQQLIEEHARLEQEARKERLYYEQKEDEEIGSSRFGLKLLCAVVTTVVTAAYPPAGLVAGAAAVTNEIIKGKENSKKANEWKEKSLQKLKIEKEQRQLQQEGLQKMADFTYEIKRLTSEGNVAEIAVKALHEASGALKHLSVIMRQAAVFWEQLSLHCETLAKPEFQKELHGALANNSREEKKMFLESAAFKEQAVKYYARWVALCTFCEDYLLQIKLTQQDLYKYIVENPTYEQSHQQLPELTEKFGDILKSAQAEIAQKDFEADEEMKKLKTE